MNLLIATKYSMVDCCWNSGEILFTSIILACFIKKYSLSDILFQIKNESDNGVSLLN